jgi:hypothetical protein
MKNSFAITIFLSALTFAACNKADILLPVTKSAADPIQEDPMQTDATTKVTSTTYTTYLIRKGNNFCDQSATKYLTINGEMKFTARFNQSAIYTNIDPVNQYDINKLWGFSEGFNNQYNSARIGWAYNDGALRLYGYVYAKGVRYSKEIGIVTIGSEIPCSIKLSGSSYLMTANGVTVALPRGLTSTKASGLQQYPYFGGDERAPQDIRIEIKPI